jgi:tetratricopeptide (TPR) repeat protein
MTDKNEIVQSLLNKADVHASNKEFKKAFQCCIKALQKEPSTWKAYFGLGSILQQLEKHDAAIVCFQRASKLNAKNEDTWNRLGSLLRINNRPKEALRTLKRGLRIAPDNILLNYNISLLYKDMNKPGLAIEFLDKVISSDSDDPLQEQLKIESKWVKGLCALGTGDFKNGWQGFESRLQLARISQPKFDGTLWQGESLQNKTLFLTYEQRYGDLIHIIRFIPLLSKMGARVLVQSPKQLTRLLQQIEEIDEVVDIDSDIPSYDFHLPITSLMPVLNISIDDIPTKMPYLKVENLNEALIPEFEGMKLKVGLIWAGKPKPDRSCPLPFLIPLLKRQEVGFYSFQMGSRRKDIFDNNVGWLLHDLSPRIDDFYSSSLLLEEMDLVITIDSAPAHQAAALAKPVWMLLIYSSDWRWMYDRDDTPWYPTMRLFRQEKPGSWQEPTQKLEKAFDEWVDEELEKRK